MAQLPFKDLVGEMTGQRTTNGYDVLVAYSESKVNQLLQNYFDSSQKELSLGPFQMNLWDERRDEGYTKEVWMQVKGPLLRFDGTDGVILNYDVVGGTTKIDNDEPKPLPEGLYIELKTKLSNVSGTVDSANKFTEDKDSDGRPATTKPPNYKVVLNPTQRQAAQCVFIEMEDVEAKVGSKPESSPSAGREADLLKTTSAQIGNYFQKAREIKYYLAGVSNTYASETNAHVLRPVSFNFSIAGAGTKEAALCMWIEVSGGAQNGERQTGPSPVTFHPKEHDRNPLPVGSTASVILSHNLIWSQFLKPNLERILIEMKAEPHTDTDAFKAKGQLNAENYKKDGYDKIDDHSTGFSRGWKWFSKRDEISFSPKEPESTVNVARGIASAAGAAARITYQSKRQKVKWNEIKETYTLFDKPIREGYYGIVHLTYSWEAKGTWTNTTQGAHPNTITLNWKGNPYWDIKGESEEPNGWENFLQQVFKTDRVPSDLAAHNIPAPTVDLRMDSLDYFLTTNLICPGEHMFKAHRIEEDESKGLGMPHDLILTGDVGTMVSS